MRSFWDDVVQKRSVGYGLIVGVLAALLLGLMARGVIDHVPMYDELLHFLAAQGMRVTGEPTIASGEYTRALLFTRLVAGALAIFGDTLVAARVSALIAAMFLLVLLAAWVTRRAGVLAGAATVACLCLIPATIGLAVFARFYTLHALIIVAIAIVLYEAAEPGRGLALRILLAGFALPLALLALHFQDTTVIAVGALACGVASVVIFDRWKWVCQFVGRYPARIFIGICLALALSLILVARVGLFDKMQEAPLWNAWAAGMPHYYLMTFAQEMPLLWPLFPIAVVFAWLGYPRLTLFSTVVVLLALVVHSIAAAKSIRYIYYILPFFCIVWGCALSEVAVLVRASLGRRDHSASRYAEYVMPIFAAIVFASSIEGQGMAKLLVGKASPAEALGLDNVSEPEWSPTIPELRATLANSERVVTSNAMKALYYLGRYDYELNASIVLETDTGKEFGTDRRTGGKAIGAADSIKQVILMPGQTLVVLEDKKMGVDVGVSNGAMQVITTQCQPIKLPVEVAVHAWSCPGGSAG